MDGPAARYDNWKAPAEDGRALIWPEPAALLRDATENGRRLMAASSARLQNVPLPEVRRRLRHWLGHADDSQPIFATGHQTELHHPGVWAKNALIDVAAAKTGGRAVHFAVDTDAPKHLYLRWPGGSVPITDAAPRNAEWSGRLPPPTPAHLTQVSREFERAAGAWAFRPLVGQFTWSMLRQALEAPDLPSALTASLHELDWGLGLRYDAMLLSPLCSSEPYLLFVHHVLARAGAFATDYNAALAEYRAEKKIRSPGRPMPDLRATPDECEVPFWLDSLADGSRARAAVVRSGNVWALRTSTAGDDEYRFDPAADGWDAAGALLAWLRGHNLRLAPRALTLTTVLRLLVADQFAHGIGGGQYDQVLDRLIARHLGLEPPRFAVTTATLFFPEAVGQPRVCLPCVKQEGHRIRHRVLGEAKMAMVRSMETLPRRSWARSALFAEMHDRLNAAVATDAGVKAWEQRFADAERRVQAERVLFDRELFYAIQPRERLEQLIGQYRAAFV